MKKKVILQLTLVIMYVVLIVACSNSENFNFNSNCDAEILLPTFNKSVYVTEEHKKYVDCSGKIYTSEERKRKLSKSTKQNKTSYIETAMGSFRKKRTLVAFFRHILPIKPFAEAQHLFKNKKYYTNDHCIYDGYHKYSEGLLNVCIKTRYSDYKCGYIDTLGTEKINFEYDFVTPFSNGHAFVGKKGTNPLLRIKDDEYQYGFIDKSNNFTPIEETHNISGRLPYLFKNSKGGNLFENNIAILYTWSKVKDGLHEKEFKFAFANKKGEIINILEKEIIYLSYFNNGKYIFKKNKKYGILSVKGDTILKPIYDNISKYSNGIAYGEIEEKSDTKYLFTPHTTYHLLNSNGEIIKEYKNIIHKLSIPQEGIIQYVGINAQKIVKKINNGVYQGGIRDFGYINNDGEIFWSFIKHFDKNLHKELLEGTVGYKAVHSPN